MLDNATGLNAVNKSHEDNFRELVVNDAIYPRIILVNFVLKIHSIV